MKKTKKVIRLKKEVKIISILLITVILVNSLKNNINDSINAYRWNMLVTTVGSILILIILLKGGDK